MSRPVKVSIGGRIYGGIIRDQSGQVHDTEKIADIVIRIPLTSGSTSLLRRRGFVNDTFIITENGIPTPYKVSGIERLVREFAIQLSGVINE